VAKSLRLAVTIMIVEVLILLGAIVPCQFEKTLPVGDSILILTFRERLIARVAEEVEVEAGLRVLEGAQSKHAKNLLVVLQGLLSILDTKHGVVLDHQLQILEDQQEW
jgi:hypothetical protein